MKKLAIATLASLFSVSSTGASAATITLTLTGYSSSNGNFSFIGTGDTSSLRQVGANPGATVFDFLTLDYTAQGTTQNALGPFDFFGLEPSGIAAITSTGLGLPYNISFSADALAGYDVRSSIGPLPVNLVSFTGINGQNFPASNLTLNIRIADAVAAVPEPATWAMMIAGFGAIGGAMRRRQKVQVRFRSPLAAA